MKQKSNETSSSRWEIKFELTAPLWILINPELVRRRTQTRAAKSKKRSVVQGFLGWKKKKGIYHSRDLRMFWTESSRTTRNTTTSSKSNLDSANFHRSRDPRGPEGGLGSGIMRQVVKPGTRAQSVSGLIRVTMLRENRTVVAPRWPIFFFFFSFFFWPPTPFRLVVLALWKRFSRSFRFVLQGYKIWKSRAIGRTNEIILY